MRNSLRLARLGAVFALLGLSCSLMTNFDDYTRGSSVASAGDGASDGAAPDANPNGEPEAGPDGGVDATADGPLTYRDIVLSDHPVGYWRLGEKSGTTAKDELGEHDGIYGGNVTLGTAHVGMSDGDTAAAFDGTSGQIDIGNFFDFPNGAPFSIEVWIKVAPVERVTTRFAFAKVDTTGENGWFFAQNLGVDGGVMDFGVINAGNWSVWGDYMTANAWSHRVGTFRSGELCSYADGLLVHCFASGFVPPSTSATTRIGASAGGGYFKGALDEVAIYNYILAAPRIKAHYDAR